MVIHWTEGGDAMSEDSWKTAEALSVSEGRWKTAEALSAQGDELASETPILVLSGGTFLCVATVEIDGEA